MRLFYLILPIFLVSVMIYHKEKSIVMIVLLVISFLARNILNRREIGIKKRDKAKDMTFWEANAKHFYTDYRRENPALEGFAHD